MKTREDERELHEALATVVPPPPDGRSQRGLHAHLGSTAERHASVRAGERIEERGVGRPPLVVVVDGDADDIEAVVHVLADRLDVRAA